MPERKVKSKPGHIVLRVYAADEPCGRNTESVKDKCRNPDPRLIQLVHHLARQAAEETIEQAMMEDAPSSE